MLENDFYVVVEKRLIEGGFEVEVTFNEKHKIYQAHFPEQPITPGVCILQIGKELLSEFYKTPLTMITAKNIKFLAVIDPLSVKQVCFKITSAVNAEGLITANIVVHKDETYFTKINALYKKG